MIVFGTAVTNAETYDRCAAPGIRRAAEPDSVILAHRTMASLFRNYNVLLDKAAAHDDLEALVLVHQDAEIADADFATKVREAFSDPDVAIVGCAGALGVTGMGWWQGAVTWASVTHHYEEYGGGEFVRQDQTEPIEVDTIDGFLMVLSPWAVRELRFDESLGKLHGYDFDICMQARAAGKKVATAAFRAIHHRSLELINDPQNWIQTYVRLAEKWDGQLPDRGADPRRRALRAEAEAACSKALMVSHQMREQAVKRRLADVERELKRTTDQLKVSRQELEATTEKLRKAETASDHTARKPTPRPAPHPAKLAAIDYGIEKLGIESFASLEVGAQYGQYAFYAIDRPTVQRGTLVDISAWRPRDQLLNVVEQAAERPGMHMLNGSFFDPEAVTEIGQVDAVLLFEVLLRMVKPDWDQVLRMYAPITRCFLIANPQWERGDTTVRLIDLGREQFLEAVPPWPNHTELFDRLHEWHAAQPRLNRDATHVWQWGITDADLRAKMEDLGFELNRERRLTPPPDTNGFVNKTFVFSRSQP